MGHHPLIIHNSHYPSNYRTQHFTSYDPRQSHAQAQTVTYYQVWTVVVGLVSRLLRSLFAGLEEEAGQPEPGDQCCPDAGAMVSEASVSVSLGELTCHYVTMSLCLYVTMSPCHYVTTLSLCH